MIEYLRDGEVKCITGGKRLISKNTKKRIERKTRKLFKNAMVVAAAVFVDPMVGTAVNFVVDDD